MATVCLSCMQYSVITNKFTLMHLYRHILLFLSCDRQGSPILQTGNWDAKRLWDLLNWLNLQVMNWAGNWRSQALKSVLSSLSPHWWLNSPPPLRTCTEFPTKTWTSLGRDIRIGSPEGSGGEVCTNIWVPNGKSQDRSFLMQTNLPVGTSHQLLCVA